MKTIGTIILLVLISVGALRKSTALFVISGVLLGLLLGAFFVNIPQLADDSGVTSSSNIYLLCLAAGFFSITLMTWIFSEETQIWPVLPGAFLSGVALILYLFL